jgi:glycosyltransferase involved in cell wall biosynthesis
MFFHFVHVPVVLELCEWPLAIASTRKSGFRKARKFCHEAVLLSDAVIPISSYIENEVEIIATSIGKYIPSFRIPILIDRDDSQFLKKSNDSDKGQYLLYAGAISYFDIASMVVDIAAVLQQKGVEMKINFTGSGPSMLFEKLKSYAAERGVLHCFNFTGYVSDEDLQSLMRGATALLAPLPDNEQSIARFPTKLGYYLSTGTPVVTNAIGDVELYLQDGVNAFVSPEYDAGLMAEKVMQLVGSPEKSLMVGERGRALAYERFHYKTACKGIRKFLESIPAPDANESAQK